MILNPAARVRILSGGNILWGFDHRNKVNSTAWLYRDGPSHKIVSFTLHYIINCLTLSFVWSMLACRACKLRWICTCLAQWALLVFAKIFGSLGSSPMREYYSVIQCTQCWWGTTCGCRDEESNPGSSGSETSPLPLGHCPSPIFPGTTFPGDGYIFQTKYCNILAIFRYPAQDLCQLFGTLYWRKRRIRKKWIPSAFQRFDHPPSSTKWLDTRRR